MTKILVTGGAGFIGSHVVRQLCARGDTVRVFHLPGERLDNLAGLDVEKVAGDVRDPAAVRQAVQGCEVVYHLAAIYALWLPDMDLMDEVNVGGTRHVFEACLQEGVAKVVYTSSIAVFGGQGMETQATEDSPFALGSTGDRYSLSKYKSHQLVAQFVARGLPVTVVAPCGPIGPGDIGPTPTGRLLLAAVQFPMMAVTETVSNMVDVRDVAIGHLLAEEKGEPGRSYLLGNTDVSLSELATMARRIRGRKWPVFSLPPMLVLGVAWLVLIWTKWISHKAPLFTPAAIRIARLGLRADCSRAFEELGLPRRPMEESVRDALAWFREQGYLDD